MARRKPKVNELAVLLIDEKEIGPFLIDELRSLLSSNKLEGEAQKIQVRTLQESSWSSLWEHDLFSRRDFEFVSSLPPQNTDGPLWYLKNGQKFGPVKVARLKKMLQEKLFHMTDQISLDDGKSWLKAFQHPEFNNRKKVPMNMAPVKMDNDLEISHQFKEDNEEINAMTSLAYIGHFNEENHHHRLINEAKENNIVPFPKKMNREKKNNFFLKKSFNLFQLNIKRKQTLMILLGALAISIPFYLLSPTRKVKTSVQNKELTSAIFQRGQKVLPKVVKIKHRKKDNAQPKRSFTRVKRSYTKDKEIYAKKARAKAFHRSSQYTRPKRRHKTSITPLPTSSKSLSSLQEEDLDEYEENFSAENQYPKNHDEIKEDIAEEERYEDSEDFFPERKPASLPLEPELEEEEEF